MLDWLGASWNKVLFIVLVVAILGALGTLGYVIAVSDSADRFTEFYLLGSANETSVYPEELEAGSEASVVVGIINHEHETVDYYVKVCIDGEEATCVGPVALVNEQLWQDSVSFTPDTPGGNRTVEFYLYRNDGAEPYLGPLYLWINVVQ